jgi:hypothetical protein
MKYFVLGTVVLAATFMIGCDSSGGVCCKGGKVESSIDDPTPQEEEVAPKLDKEQNDENMTVSYSKSLTSYDWNVTTTGEVPDDANCTFTSTAPTVVISKICFGIDDVKNSVNVVLKGVDDDNQTVDYSETLELNKTTLSDSEGGGG